MVLRSWRISPEQGARGYNSHHIIRVQGFQRRRRKRDMNRFSQALRIAHEGVESRVLI